MDIKPKITLDENYLRLINKWYNTKIGSQLLNWQCFSSPELSSHSCNVFAKLHGDQECEYCEHIPYRECMAMCYIHHFCLAAFAARLNLNRVEAQSLEKTVIGILKKWRYPTLNKRVVQTVDLLAQAKVSVPVLDEFKKDEKMPELSEKVSDAVKPSKEIEKKKPNSDKVKEEKTSDNSLIVSPEPALISPPMPSKEVLESIKENKD